MKKTPYSLYIHLEELSSVFKGSTSRQGNLIRCGFTGIELSTKLLGGAIKQGNKTHSDKVSDILKGIETQFRLLNAYASRSEGKRYKENHSENLENLKLLNRSYAGAIDRISTLYFDISEKVKTKLGLEKQFNEIRSHFQLSEIAVEVEGVSDGKESADIIGLFELGELTYFNSEDELFMITHQISECWFNVGISELKAIHTCFQQSKTNPTEIETHFRATYDILIYLANHVLLLEHMVVSDYHPLRVALRGASGGQSQQAHELFSLAQKVFSEFLMILQQENKEIMQVLETPNTHPNLISIIKHFEKLERSLKNFFFQHYLLSSSVIGSQSFGSIGHDLVSLTDKFVEPVFKEIDQAKYDLTLKTNFQYGTSAGILILEKEDCHLSPAQNEIIKPELISQVIDGYFHAISKLDSEGWIQLFSEDGYIEDPIGSRPYIGHRQLAIFFKGVVRFFSDLSMTIENKRIKDNHAEILWKANAITYNSKEITFKGKEVFQINPEGKILAAQVHWDPAIIAEQL